MEFETMLRRHLTRGGAPVSPCAGFDTDTASSYLEGALWSPSRTRYELHLAGCPSCRQNLIGLARLSQSVVVREAPASAVVRESKYWEFWRSKVNRWVENPLGVSSWRWNLTVAGSAIAACSILIAVLVSQPWQQDQQNKNGMSAVVKSSNGEYNVAATVPVPTPSPAILADSQSVLTERKEQIDPQESGRQRAKGPVPPDRDLQVLDRIIAGDQNKNESTDKIDANIQRLSGITEGPVQAPVSISQSGFTKPSGPNNGQSNQQNLILDGETRTSVLKKGLVPDDPRESAKLVPQAEVAANSPNRSDEKAETADKSAPDSTIVRITLPPEDNPRQSRARASAKARDTKTVASAATTSKTGWIGRVMSGRRGLAPNQTPEAEKKTDDTEAKDETEKFLIRYLRHKTFSYQRGFWVDHEYKPEEDMYRVTHLVRGSKEFESLLAKEPQLKEFFSLGKIILVWRERIFRVSDR
ncbi:MAG: zf-HC2 domain-containing protein [Acidobacteria bacterium]|nr:zf-HC2 domain-containing protein [Acidobacteriota bacterium]